MHDKPLIVLYTHKLPYPHDTGTNQRIKTLVAYLRQRYRVGLVVPTYHVDIEHLEQDYDGIWYGSRYDSLWNKLRWQAGLRIKRFLLQIKVGASVLCTGNPMARVNVHAAWQLYRVCRKETVALIIVQKILNTVPATAIAHHLRIPVVLDTHDLFYVGKASKPESAIGLTASNIHTATAQDELSLLRQYDALIAIQHEDADILRRQLPSMPVITALHPIKAIRKRRSFQNPHTSSLLFVGSASAHNVDALDFFLTNCFPNIVGQCPDIRLDICGSVTATVAIGLPNVHLHGRVENLDDYYAAATLVINPILAGSGLKIKTVEAIAHGKCLVTTPIGIEGLVGIHEAVVCVQPELLAENIVRLLRQPDLILAYEEKALGYARNNLTEEMCYQEISPLIEKLTTKRNIA